MIAAPWGAAAPVLALVAVLMAALVFRRLLGRVLKLAAKTGLGLAALAALKALGGGLGLTLGVNLFSALVIALLGAPGLGLLLMLNWVINL